MQAEAARIPRTHAVPPDAIPAIAECPALADDAWGVQAVPAQQLIRCFQCRRQTIRLHPEEHLRPNEYYVGVTSDPDLRLKAHNAGSTGHTSAHRPWRILVCIAFDEEEPARKFERYLKSGSGRRVRETALPSNGANS